jgi:phospholipase C
LPDRQPDYSIPILPNIAPPHVSPDGLWDGTALCEAQFPVTRPPVPYGKQNINEALFFEEGFKECIGYLTEGRYLVFDMSGYALANPSSDSSETGSVAISPTNPDYRSKNQRWVIHYSQGEESGIFKISSALDGRWLGPRGSLLPVEDQDDAANIKITFLGNGNGYDLQYVDSPFSHLRVDAYGALSTNDAEFAKDLEQGFKVWSVSYHD